MNSYLTSENIVKKLNERLDFYLKDLEDCDKRGLDGKSLHHRTIIDELNLILGHEHKWNTWKSWRMCETCRKLEELIQ